MLALLAAADGHLSMQFLQDAPLTSATLYTFFIAMIAMGAGAAFFVMMLFRGDLQGSHYSAVALSAIICGIACVNYAQMTDIYRSTGGDFPTAVRYIDWLLTTPLLLLTFPILLELGRDSVKVFLQLVLLDVAMIVLAFVAEISPMGSRDWWLFFGLSCLCEVFILAILFFSLRTPIFEAPAELATSLQVARMFVLIGWAVYPIGFLMALSGYGEPRELIYNVADVINKVGFGIVVHTGIVASLTGLGWSQR